MDLAPKEKQLVPNPILVGRLLALYFGHGVAVGIVVVVVGLLVGRLRGLQVRVAVFAEGAVALARVIADYGLAAEGRICY